MLKHLFYFLRLHGDCTIEISISGITFLRNGIIHRDGNKPAIILSDGTKKYYKYGKFIK